MERGRADSNCLSLSIIAIDPLMGRLEEILVIEYKTWTRAMISSLYNCYLVPSILINNYRSPYYTQKKLAPLPTIFIINHVTFFVFSIVLLWLISFLYRVMWHLWTVFLQYVISGNTTQFLPPVNIQGEKSPALDNTWHFLLMNNATCDSFTFLTH